MGILNDFLDIFIDSMPKRVESIYIQSLYSHYEKSLPKVFFDDVFVGVQYEEIFPLLELYKFQSDRNAGKRLAEIFVKIFEKIPDISDEYVIIPIPMHWTRYRIRGIDSLEYVAKNIKKITTRPYISLLSARFSKRQMTLSKEERQKNRLNNFFVKKMQKIPEKVILIDDIITTGVTVNEASRVLREVGVQNIIVVTLSSHSL